MGQKTILVTGGTGQVGQELLRQTWPDDITLLAPPRSALDIASNDSIRGWFGDRQIDCIINAAAYTAVDRAETEIGAAFLANAQGPAWLAEQASACGAALLHLSTDYVFDGQLNRPYRETDVTMPLGVYGASKLAGELAVRAGAPRHVILRTAWVISARGRNFLKTMLRLAGEQTELRVVADQHGCPTGASDIAAALRTIALRHLEDPEAPCGTFHFANSGSTTWHGLARALLAEGRPRGRLNVPIVAIGTNDFPTAARRPANSRLDTSRIEQCFGIAPRAWQETVAEIMAELHPEPVESAR